MAKDSRQRRAADRDVRHWAHQEAAARLTRAVALIDQLPAADAAAVYPVLLDQLGHVRRGLGDLPGTLQTCETLAAWARDHGEIRWEASAVLHRATVLTWVDSEASRVASIEGMRLSQCVDDPLLRANAQGHAVCWQLHLHGARLADLQTAEATVAAARTAGDRELLAQSAFVLALFQLACSDLRAAAQTAAEGIEIARETGNAHTCLWSYTVRVDALLQLGEWGVALAAIDEGLRIGAQISRLHFSSLLRSEAASLHTDAFDFALDRARGEAEALQTLAASVDEPKPRAEAAWLLAEIALQGRHLSDAEVHLREARAAIEACALPLVDWRIATTVARVHDRQRRRAEAQAARLRSAALVSQLADSLPPEHVLRRSFLEHA